MEGEVIFKDKSGFREGTKIPVDKEARLTFGNNFLIPAKSEIAYVKEITFSNNCLLSWDILVMDTNDHPKSNMESERINEDEPIKIGNHIWISC